MPNRLKNLTPEASARHLFGFELRGRRLAARMTMLGLASRVHVDRSIVSRIECAKRYPSHRFATLCDQIFKTGNHFVGLYEDVQAERPPDGRKRSS